jgi:hypothetical protein
LKVRLIHTSDWHFGAGYDQKKWGELADRRRTERVAAVLQILSYAQKVKSVRGEAWVQAGQPLQVPRALRKQMHDPSMLRRCSWQSILSVMQDFEALQWLVKELGRKYGLDPRVREAATDPPPPIGG